MYRNPYGLPAILGGGILLTAFYAAGLFVPTPGATTGTASAIGAAAVIVANGIGLLLTSRRVSGKATLTIPFIYIALVAANPWALHGSAFHPASLLMLASIYCYLSFCAVRPSLTYLLGSFFLLGAAGLFVPPLLWLFPLFLLLSIGRTDEKGKYLVTAFIGMALPLLIQAGVVYLRTGADDVLSLPAAWWTGMTDVHPHLRPFSAATLFRILLTVAATLMAAFHIIQQLNTYKTVQFLAFVRLITLAAVLCLMALVFPENSHTPCYLITCLPVTLVLNEFFVSHGARRTKIALAVAAILLLVAERIGYLL